MAIEYTPVQLKNPTKLNEPAKWYAKAAMTKSTDLDEIATTISKHSTTVSHIDVYAVLLALTDEIGDRLANGENVHLGKLGYFRTTIKSKGIESKEKVNTSLIEDVKVRFTAGKSLEDKIKTVGFTLSKK